VAIATNEVVNASKTICGVMEGAGAYNQHATLQAAGGDSAIPLLEAAAKGIHIDRGPLVIADYGSSEGKNSLMPLKAAIAVLHGKTGPTHPICVVHTDLPANDFTSLFKLLETDPNSYLRNDPAVFASAIGKSFYEHIFPQDYVDLGWSAYAAVWLSKIPTLIGDHFWIPCSQGELRQTFHRQAAQDWQTFLTYRADELKPGGSLVVVLPGLLDAGSSGLETIMNHANSVLVELVEEGVINIDEKKRMMLAAYPREKFEMLAPFEKTGMFQNLTVQHCDVRVVTDAAWTNYERHGERDKLAKEHTLFFRSTFAPTLSSALDASRSPEERAAFADGLEARLEKRLVANPHPLHRVVGTIVVSKKLAAPF
jgi:hypothetical protein